MVFESEARTDAGTVPASQRERAPLHESDPSLLDGISDPGDGTVAETGTTVVGLAAEEAVVLAADRRASVGGGRFVTSKRVRKVEPVHPTAAVALSGAVGHIQHFVRTLRAETRLYEDRRGEPMSLTALSTLAGNVLGSAPLHVSPVLGGVDSEGPGVYGLDGGGGVLPDAYAAGGSGMQVAYGVLERQYEDGLSPEAARGVAARAVDAAGERDTASGNGLMVATITRDGIDAEAFGAASAADADADTGAV
jgi:proteasome beta subunit